MEENIQRDLGYIFPNIFQFIVRRADPSSRNEQPRSFPQTQLDTAPLSVWITSFVVQLCYGCAFESGQIRWYTPVASIAKSGSQTTSFDWIHVSISSTEESCASTWKLFRIHRLCMSGIGKSKLGQRAIREMHKYENLNFDFRCLCFPGRISSLAIVAPVERRLLPMTWK